MFKYFEESTWQEKKEMENQLLAMYKDVNEDNTECYEAYHQNKTAKNKQNYFESVQRLDAILDVFEILRLDCGQNLDD